MISKGGNKLFPICKSISNTIVQSNKDKIKGFNFTGVYPSPASCIILSGLFIKLEDIVCVLVILTAVHNKWFAIGSQNAIPNNFEEY